MNKTTLTKYDHKRYRKQLLSLSKRLSGDVDSLEAEATRSVGAEKAGTDEPIEQTDRAAREAEADVARTLLTSQEHILEEVRIALSHLDDGTFGKCELCGQPIGRARLDVLPYARRCLCCSSESSNIETT